MSNASSSKSQRHSQAPKLVDDKDKVLAKDQIPEKKWFRKFRGPKNGFGGPLRVILSTIIIFIVSQFIAVLIVELLSTLSGHSSSPGSWFEDSAGLQFLFIFLAEGLAVWLVLKLLKRRSLSLASIGLSRLPKWSDLKWVALGFGAFYGLVILVSLILTFIFPSLNLDQQQDIGFKNLSGPIDQLLVFISLVLLPPIGEEILVRGYLYSGLRSKLKFLPALLITSLFFGAAHFQSDGSGLVWVVAADTFLLSMVLVYVREKSGVLYSAMGIHALNNLVAYFVHFHG